MIRPFPYLILSVTLGFLHTSCMTLSPKAVKAGTDQNKVQLDKSLEIANQYARDGLYREAIEAFRTYLEKSPHDAAAHRTLGILLVKAGSYKSALQHLQGAFPQYQENFELNFYLGEAHRMDVHYADAIYHYKRALESDPKSTAVLKALAWSYYNIRYYSEALRTAKQLRKIAPNDFQVAIILARVLNKTNMNDRALTLLNRAEAVASTDAMPYINSVKGDILWSSGSKAEAEIAYRKALQDQPLLPGALLGLARRLIEDKKNHELVITYLDRAVRLKPSLLEGYYLLGKAHQESNPNKAREYFKIFAKEATFDPDYQQQLAEIRPHIAELHKQRARASGVSSSSEEEQF